MPITKATASSIAPAAKGDLVVGSATNDASVLAVGSANQVLTVDSSTATGLKWATPSSGGMTEIASGSLNSSGTTISSIPGTYKNLLLILQGITALSSFDVRVRPANANLVFGGVSYDDNAGGQMYGNGTGKITNGSRLVNSSGAENAFAITIYNYASTVYRKSIGFQGGYYSTGGFFQGIFGGGLYQSASAISSITVDLDGTTLSAGNYILYGVS